jgi:L-ascorbate metabolism protein UlaG (beta-lactamase superfamily)
MITGFFLLLSKVWVKYIFHRHKGPASHNFKHNRFHNHSHVVPHSLRDVLKWMWTRKPMPWPAIETPSMPSPPERVHGKDLRITFVNHSTFLIQTQGVNILTDPVLSKTIGPIPGHGVKRLAAPGLTLDQLPKIDAILISHDHYDHLDAPTVRQIVRRDGAKVFAGLGIDTILKGKHIPASHIQTLDWGQAVEAFSHIKFHFVPVQHWSGRWLWDRNASLWGGFIIETPTKKVFFAGDTGYGPHFQSIHQQFGPMDIALLPIGAYEPRWFMADMHMNPEEAVRAHQDLHAKLSIAMHFGTFQLADEGHDQPVKDLKAALKKHKISADKFKILPMGGGGDPPASVVVASASVSRRGGGRRRLTAFAILYHKS